MEILVDTIPVVALLLFIAAVLAPALLAAWRRVRNDPGCLPIWRAMERRGLDPADAAGEERALAVAVRRCTMCPSVAECEQWLAGKRDDPGWFCPNAMFLENLERAKRGGARR